MGTSAWDAPQNFGGMHIFLAVGRGSEKRQDSVTECETENDSE